MIPTLEQAVSAFGRSTAAKLSNIAISGAPEDQLRGPLEALVADIALITGCPPGALAIVGETTLAEDRTRPDYAVTLTNTLVGFIEVKAPGKGANPRQFKDRHDKAQWERLKSLPNLLYTDGNAFALWRDGERVGDVVRLMGDVESSGDALAAPPALLALFNDFFTTLPQLKLFITDTLGNPFAEEEHIPHFMQPVAQSRRAANQIKRNEKITVVIGNPPYKEKADGRGGWIEAGSEGYAAPMDRWRPPAAWGVGAHAKHLKNLYVYFWRWASLKVFGAGWHDATGLPDGDEEGIVCFITVAGFLNGPGFEKMRADLRASCADIFVIDCTPEGHQPEVATRIFQGVQQPVCIVLAARRKGKDAARPGRVHFRALPEGRREEKFAALSGIALGGPGWAECPDEWRAPFLPEMESHWLALVPLKHIFEASSSGILAGRTWIISPDQQTLQKRWETLTGEGDPQKKETLFHPTLRHGKLADRHTNKIVNEGLFGHEKRAITVANDMGPPVKPIHYACRSFDRQWIIPDNRLILSSRPALWAAYSDNQTYLTALAASSPTSGPAVSFAGLLPDYDHYKGSFNGRVFPLWSDAAATRSNLNPAVLAGLSDFYGEAVAPPDLMAYVAAVLAHPAFTARFAADLKQPGLRVPVTADAALFRRAVDIGREVIWLHTYGERFHDAAAGRPHQAPRLDKAHAPSIPVGGTIPGAPEPLPETMDYDPATRRLTVGKGHVDNVMREVWAYEVSGKQVLKHWFSYRRRDRTRPVIGDRRPPSPLDSIQPDHWLGEYTTDLMNLLHVLGRLVLLEPRQAALLEETLGQPLLGIADLGLAPDNGSDSREDAADGPA